MKDKEKQIEEMAKRIHIATDLYYIECIKIATYLYEKDNCRIVPKDSVVLSREEYDTLKAENDKYVKDCINYLATINKLENKVWEVEQRSNKETAEEILNAVVGAIDNGTFSRKSFIFMMNKVYGVEVKE
jgi:hypothetical protein